MNKRSLATSGIFALSIVLFGSCQEQPVLEIPTESATPTPIAAQLKLPKRAGLPIDSTVPYHTVSRKDSALRTALAGDTGNVALNLTLPQALGSDTLFLEYRSRGLRIQTIPCTENGESTQLDAHGAIRTAGDSLAERLLLQLDTLRKSDSGHHSKASDPLSTQLQDLLKIYANSLATGISGYKKVSLAIPTNLDTTGLRNLALIEAAKSGRTMVELSAIWHLDLDTASAHAALLVLVQYKTIPDISGLYPPTGPVYTNLAPEIRNLADTTVEPGTARIVRGFDLSDDHTAVKDLALTLQTDNPALVSLDSLTFGAGLGAHRILSINPTAGAYGTASLTLSARDSAGKTGTTPVKIVVAPPATFPDLPKIAAFSDRDTFLNFTVSPDTAHPSVVSTNPSLLAVSDSQLVRTADGWTLRLHPLKRGTGTVKLAFQTRRGNTTTIDSVTILIAPVNTPPIIDSLPAWRGVQDGPAGRIALHRLDDLTQTANLVAEATVSDEALFTVSVVGDTLVWSPKPGAEGSARITVKVTDAGGLSTTRTFQATLLHFNHAPTIASDNSLVVSAIGYGTAVKVPFKYSGSATEAGQTATFSVIFRNPADAALFSVQPFVDGQNLEFTPLVPGADTVQLYLRVKDNGGTENGGIDSALSPVSLYFTDTIVDARDGRVYHFRRIGTQTWMTENVRFTPKSGQKWAQGDSTLGQMYANYDEIVTATGCLPYDHSIPSSGPCPAGFAFQQACPDGWRTSSSSDWTTLVKFASIDGTEESALPRIYAKNAWWTKSWGPSGYATATTTYENSTDELGMHLRPTAKVGGAGSGGGGENALLIYVDPLPFQSYGNQTTTQFSPGSIYVNATSGSTTSALPGYAGVVRCLRGNP